VLRLLGNVSRDLFVLSVVLFMAVYLGIENSASSFLLPAAAATPVMLFLGLASGSGLRGGYGKLLRAACLVVLTGLIFLAVYIMNSGGALRGVGLVICSSIAGFYFVQAVIILWVVYGIQRVLGT